MTERPSDQHPGEADEAAVDPMPFRVRAFDDEPSEQAAPPAERRVRPLDRVAPQAARGTVDADLDAAAAEPPSVAEVEPDDTVEGDEGLGPEGEVDGDLLADADGADDLAGDVLDGDDLDHDDIDEDGTGPVRRPGSERAAMLQRAKANGGTGGAMLMGALLGIKDVLEKPREQPAVVMEASGQPHDIDADGLEMDLDDERRAVAPPLPVMNHLTSKRKRRFGRRR